MKKLSMQASILSLLLLYPLVIYPMSSIPESHDQQQNSRGQSPVELAVKVHLGAGWNIGNQELYGGTSNSQLYGGQIYFNTVPSSDSFFGARLGLDLSYIRAYSPVVSGVKLDYDFFNVGLISEFFMMRYFLMQAGWSVYIPKGDNDVTELGFMLGYGFRVPITDSFELSVVGRFDFMDEQRIIFSGVAGILFRFNLGRSKKRKKPPIKNPIHPQQAYLDGQGYGAF